MASPCHYTISSTLLLPIIIILYFASHLPPCISTVDHDHNPHDDIHPSPSTFSIDYQRMLSTFKIFSYAPPLPLNFTSSAALFHSSLLSSPFLTTNPHTAHLFYLPIAPNIRTRPLERVISRVRSSSLFWNRSLAADHFFLSSCSRAAAASPSSSARNIVELRKNAVRVTCFSSPAGYFIPHKDVSLPPSPLTRFTPKRTRSGQNYKYLGFLMLTGSVSVRGGAELIEGLRADPEFVIESQPLDDVAAYGERLESSRFCLFVYEGEVVGLGEALAYGCVPVVVTDRPIQDMPLMDVLRWQEIALFVGPAGLKEKLNEVVVGKRYERMKRLGVAAAQHFVWNDPPKPYDAFHMVVYQLWLRRHTVRYATSR